MKSKIRRESKEWEKKYPTERYYEPNFPIFKAEECAEFKALRRDTEWIFWAEQPETTETRNKSLLSP